MAVVVAGELDDDIAAGEAAGQANGAHRRFGAAELTSRTFSIDGTASMISSREFAFGLGRRAEARSARCDRFSIAATTAGWPMTEDHRPPRADVVDVAIAVDVVRDTPLRRARRRSARRRRRRTPGPDCSRRRASNSWPERTAMAFVAIHHELFLVLSQLFAVRASVRLARPA